MRNYYSRIKYLLAAIATFIALPVAAEISIDEEEFEDFLHDIEVRAAAAGISKETVEKTFATIKPSAKSIELDRKQPESTTRFDEYIKMVVSPGRIRKGKRLLKENEWLLGKVSKQYNVQPRFIVALWGIETDYGANTGGFHVPSVLATLAFEGRRKDLFSEQLIDALQIIDKGHIEPEEMKGSWAGAMGQTQFMPSSFLNFAEDYNKDGKRDIWGNRGDVFASIANYLTKAGWTDEGTWGRKVNLPKNFNYAQLGWENAMLISDWSDVGVRRIDGTKLPDKDIKAAVIMPDGKKGGAFLVYDNYKTILKWNRSNYFACAVGLLSDAIGR